MTTLQQYANEARDFARDAVKAIAAFHGESADDNFMDNLADNAVSGIMNRCKAIIDKFGESEGCKVTVRGLRNVVASVSAYKDTKDGGYIDDALDNVTLFRYAIMTKSVTIDKG